MELKNRIMMSAIGTHESVESEGRKSVIDKLIAYHTLSDLVRSPLQNIATFATPAPDALGEEDEK